MTYVGLLITVVLTHVKLVGEIKKKKKDAKKLTGEGYSMDTHITKDLPPNSLCSQIAMEFLVRFLAGLSYS